MMTQYSQAFSSSGGAPIEFCYWHLLRLPRDMILLPHQACVALKRKAAAMATRAPRTPTIVGRFFLLPSPEFVVDSVALPACHLALAAARAPLAALFGDPRNDNKLATTRGGPTGAQTAVRGPSCGVRELPRHGGRANSPAQ